MKNEFNFKELVESFLKNIYQILAISFALSLSAAVITTFIPNKYISEALLAQTSSDLGAYSSSGAISGFGGLANLGIGQVNDSNALEGVEVIKSFEFFKIILEKNPHFKASILAAKKADDDGNIIFDDSIYDVKKQEFKKTHGFFSIKELPTDLDAYKTNNKNLVVSRSNETGFISIQYEHVSPFFAKEFIEVTINEINKRFRERDILRSENSITFLKKEISNTNLKEIDNALSELIQEQLQKTMLAKSRQDYLFSIIESPYIPEDKSWPQRFLIVLIIFLSSIVLISFGYFFVRLKNE